MKYAAPFFLCLSMLSFEALSQIPDRGVPQPDPLILLMLSLAPFVIIFIMVVVLLYIARWIFKARHKEKMQLLENIEQHLSSIAHSQAAARVNVEASAPTENI